MISSFKKDKIIKQIYNKKEFVAALAALLVFLFMSVTNLKNVNPAIENVQNYDELVKNPYERYESILSGEKVNKLIKDEQFIEMNYIGNLIKKEQTKTRKNPFLETF